jgi:hypothetical protein
MSMTKIYALTKEHEKPMFVTTLTYMEFDELGDFGIELLVEAWCKKKGYSYVDFGTD